ncbi:phosphodiesterase [Hypericibacter adhaerens]|uniref:Phosphodiesterase n=1 Tax=Hypericibacter adhaerens TaxID=2602016 RepID=A0A5J6MXB5_9PROT|nr:HD domain-containing phosphohydrolase [Hypericibacter adhaerens]QEX21814.1 phosphodiesterase [Hypericibacter adhaerens]
MADRPGFRKRTFRLHIYIATLFLALLVAFAAISIATQHYLSRGMMLSSAETLFNRIGQEVKQSIAAIYQPARSAAELLSRSSLIDANTLDKRLVRLPLMAAVLQNHQEVSAVYVGYQNGDFFLLRRFDPHSFLGRALGAPPEAAYLVQSMARDTEGLRDPRFVLYSDDLTQLSSQPVPNYIFDPRTRPWYQAAQGQQRVISTAPYLFYTTREVGATVAQASINGTAVVGVDVTLGALSSFLDTQRPTPSAQIFIFNEKGEVLADTDSDYKLQVDDLGTPRLPKIEDLSHPLLSAISAHASTELNRTRAYNTPDGIWQGIVTGWASDKSSYYIAIAAPQRELLATATRIRNISLWLSVAMLLFAIPITYILSRLASGPLKALIRETRAVQALKFDEPITVRSFIDEIDKLARSMDRMKSTIHRLLSIGSVLGGERKFDRLLSRILSETTAITNARGGLIYLVNDDGKLEPRFAYWDGQDRQIVPTLFDLAQDKDHPLVIAFNEGKCAKRLSVEDLRRWHPHLNADKPLISMAVALRDRQGQVIGVLLVSPEEESLSERTMADRLALVEAISGTAAVAIETQRLIQEQKDLLQSLIELTAGAIDSKSAYTGGHCQRVPVLTELLAEAAQDSEDGAFKDFSLTEEQWEELHIAAWLHDCGKVTSPEYVIDKATKLETIYDRLHEVRMRFEVIKREAEVACWKSIAEGADRTAALAELDKLWATLDEEFAFLARSNVGGEFMAPPDIERVRKIAERRWTRTLDDRIGVSYDEAERKSRQQAAPLPVSEPLLADKPEHIILRPDREKIAADNPWGFKVKVPEYLYNRGEIYNLTIQRGTLTEEERYKINEHMIETIRMLTRLPLPRHLRNAPEIAGGHHEKMDGTGYPKRLKRDEMSVPARMMAIADIFEALTAGDRPYKKAKTLSESLAIMAKMRDTNHIDPDLFDLFLASGVYRRYSEQYLSPAQIDAVDIEPLRRRASA